MSKPPGDRRPLSREELAAARGALPAGNPLSDALAGIAARAGFTMTESAPAAPHAVTPPVEAPSAPAPDTTAEPDEEFLERAKRNAEAKRRSDARRGIVRDNAEEIQAEATARARTAIPPAVVPTPIDKSVPPDVGAAADLPMNNPPVHRAQIKPIPGEIDVPGFLARVRALLAMRKLSKAAMMDIARAIVYFIGKAASPEQAVAGVAQASYQSLATHAQRCRTTAWRAVKAFRARGILDIFNVPEREGNDFYRAANAYVLRGFTKAVPAVIDAVKDAVTGAFDRVTEQVRRFAHVWDMRANLRGGRPAPEPRTHPAPS
jgi:hypothetical protein